MKATELMIGDFVLYNDDICIVDEIRVDNTAILTALNTNVTSIDGDQVSVDEITPIPLTPEILERNGFVKQAYDGWLICEDNGRGLIEYRTDYFDGFLRINYTKKPFSKISVKLKHVHELQHALRLCGIDKEITI